MNAPAGALSPKVSSKCLFLKVSSAMLIEHFLYDDVGGKHTMCGLIKIRLL